jgi:short-subunit dehydrogenase
VARVAVITGASSGIGRAIAIALASRGIDVVVAARRVALLREVTVACRQYGVRAIAVETDVTNQDEVDRLGQAVIDEFGSYDIWINNAAITMLGSFMELQPDMFRRVIETNLFGYVYGAWTALRQFKAQEHGVLINISSLLGRVPSPYESPYVASKYAVTGLSASLRQEMELMNLHNVHICTVIPAAIDTPIYRNAANITGRPVRPIAPLYSVDAVTAAVLRLIDEPQAEVVVGRAGRQTALLYTFLPRKVFEHLYGRYIDASHFRKGKAPIVPGNVFVPGEYEGVSGGWFRPLWKRKHTYYAAAGFVAGVGLLLWYALRKKRTNHDE